VLLVDRDTEGLESLARSLDSPRIACCAADLADDDAPERIVTRALDSFGRLTTVLHIAGVYRRVSTPDTSRADVRTQLTINLEAPFWLTQAALPHLAGGQVLFCASTAALVGSAQGAAYCASKAGVLGMTRALAAELAPRGIRVNAIAPGTTDTLINENWLDEQSRAQVIGKIPDGRIGRAEDMVGSALFLVSDLADHIHGQTLVVDGGLSIA
jgi:NAD(P)-dependent dehydrogenase (short-subunit alcohol dehydrogenase family)